MPDKGCSRAFSQTSEHAFACILPVICRQRPDVSARVWPFCQFFRFPFRPLQASARFQKESLQHQGRQRCGSGSPEPAPKVHARQIMRRRMTRPFPSRSETATGIRLSRSAWHGPKARGRPGMQARRPLEVSRRCLIGPGCRQRPDLRCGQNAGPGRDHSLNCLR